MHAFDRRTDGQTDRHLSIARRAYALQSHGKKRQFWQRAPAFLTGSHWRLKRIVKAAFQYSISALKRRKTVEDVILVR